MPKLRIGLTISGAVSLGAYEGGALAALLIAVQRMQGAVVIDAITGASAGAMTAVLAARCLLRGTDPVEAMKQAWVDLPSLKRLASRDLGSPLSGKVLQEAADDLLGDGTGALPDGDLRQDESIAVAITLASLGGFEYLIRDLQKGSAVHAVTHLDWAEFMFDSDSPPEEWALAAQASLASGANAVGFPPYLLRRSGDDVERAVQNGIKNPPRTDGAWYTDGGTIDNEPFGRVLDLISDRGHDDRRLFLLVHPHPSTTPPDDLWTDPTQTPRWSRTGLRAKKLQGVQSIYDDLRRLEKTNTRLLDVEKLVERLEDAAAEALGDVDPAVADGVRDALVGALRKTLEDQHRDKVRVNETIGRRPPSPLKLPEKAELGELLRLAIHRATGLAGKHPASVEIVSPALDHSGKPAEELLAGERLGHFFGFLGDRFRQNDFALGYRHMMIFLEDALPLHGVGDEVAAVLPDVERGYQALGWSQISEGDATFKALKLAEKLGLVRLGGQVGLIVQNDVRKWNKGRSVAT
jgi:predicted acylesterase/phospholipase RssA